MPAAPGGMLHDGCKVLGADIVWPAAWQQSGVAPAAGRCRRPPHRAPHGCAKRPGDTHQCSGRPADACYTGQGLPIAVCQALQAQFKREVVEGCGAAGVCGEAGPLPCAMGRARTIVCQGKVLHRRAGGTTESWPLPHSGCGLLCAEDQPISFNEPRKAGRNTDG